MAEDKIASIFKRGGQKVEYGASAAAGEGGGGVDGADAEQQLQQHLQQLAVAWAAPKLKKGLAAAVWRPAVGAFEVIERGRQAFNGQGFTHNKKLYLNIEEAVYLLDRATTLLLIESEVQQPQQQEQQQQQQQVQLVVQQRLLSVQEALHMMAVLGVQHDRLCVLSYLSRLGFTVRRHPACWQVPAHVPACSTWQVNPAWEHTDGLPPLTAAPAPAAGAATAAAAAAATAAAAAVGARGATLPQHQHGSNGCQQQQQQQQQASSPAAEQEQAAKRRKVQDTAPEQQQQQQQDRQQEKGTPVAEPQLEPEMNRQWYGALPAWLHPQQQQQQLQRGSMQGQQDGEAALVAPLLGLQLQQHFPLLRPLQRYRDTAAGAVSPLPQQQQPETPGMQQECCPAVKFKGAGRVSDVVFDVLVKHDATKFSYKQPPAPQFSIAMMHPGCSNLPRLDEVLDLSLTVAAAAGTGAGAAGGAAPAPSAAAVALTAAAAEAVAVASGSNGSDSSSRVSYRAVKFGLPEEGDVGFCELVPMRLMDLLTNM